MTSPPALLDGFEAIDGQGNLWAQAPSSDLYTWTPAQLLQSCASTMPAIGLAAFITGPIAFDSQGSLWTASGSGYIEGYSSSDLGASQSTGPSWVVAGDCGAPNLLCNPSGLAFDSNGYLWVANLYSVLAFAPTTLDQSPDAGLHDPFPNTPADLTLTSAAELDAGDGNLPYARYVFNDLAFDAAGNLWTSIYDYQANPATHEIVEFTQAQLQNLDTDEDPTPAFTIHETAAQQQAFLGWVALAFDVDGNLWAGSQSGAGPNLFRFSPASLAKDGLPDITLTVPGDPSISLAFSPIPAGLPIQP